MQLWSGQPFSGQVKWTGEAILAPESHMTLKFVIRSCFGTSDAILARKYFLDPHMAHLLA